MTDNQTEEKKEEPKETPIEEKSTQAKEEKPSAAKVSDGKGGKLSSKLEKVAKEIEGFTALELSELSSYLEEKFGVSAMPMAVSGGAAATPAGGETAPAEEKSTYSVVLTDAGANKLAVIKAVREIKPDLGLMDAKKLVESAPKEVVANVKKDDAASAKKKIEEAGGKVELK